MSLLTQVSNKIQYSISQAVSDPNADAYAEQQAKQAKQEADIKKREADAAAQAKKDADAKAVADKEAADLTKRSRFSPSRATGSIASGILNTFLSLLFFALMLYGGHLAANEAFGYNIPFRILSFIYGCLLFWIYIPKTLLKKFYYKMDIPYYGFLPLTTYQADGFIESIFYGPFSIIPGSDLVGTKSQIEELYRAAFTKSQIKTE